MQLAFVDERTGTVLSGAPATADVAPLFWLHNDSASPARPPRPHQRCAGTHQFLLRGLDASWQRVTAASVAADGATAVLQVPLGAGGRRKRAVRDVAAALALPSLCRYWQTAEQSTVAAYDYRQRLLFYVRSRWNGRDERKDGTVTPLQLRLPR